MWLYSDTFVLLLLMMLLSDAHTNPIIFLRICKTWTLPRVIRQQKKSRLFGIVVIKQNDASSNYTVLEIITSPKEPFLSD